MGVNGLYGLSGSGLDIESMVKAGMLTKQNQYDKMYKKEVKNEWLKQGFNEIYTSLNTFKYSTLSDYKMSSKMSAMKASSSDSSAVTATANGDAVAMTHTVKVNGTSSNAYLMTEKSITREVGDESEHTIALKDMLFKEIASDHVYQINGANVTAERSTDEGGNVSIKFKQADGSYLKNDDDEVVYNSEEEFQAAIDGGNVVDRGTMIRYKADENDGYHYVSPNATAIQFTIKDSRDELSEDDKKKQTLSYTYDDLLNGKSLYDLAADIKSKGTKVQASYDLATDSFSLYNNTGGAANAISFDLSDASEGNGAMTAKLLNNLNLVRSENGELKSIAETDPSKRTGEGTKFALGKELGVTGSNGGVTIDGREYTDIEDNRITVAGVTYSLLDAEVGKTVRVTVSQDTDTIINNVKKFVEDYNKILDDLTEKYNTKPDGDYEPLTKTQESTMTKEQVEKWTEKAKSGIFYHNDILRGIISDMRDAIMTPVQSVNSNYNSAAAIGITSSNNQGHLQLDEDKLKKALAADPDCVYQIFASDQDTYTEVEPSKRQSYMAKDDYNNRGIANRLYFNAITDGISDIQDYAGVLADSNDQSALGLLITNLKTKMDSFKTLMDDYQTQLYKKYDALEVMISRMNAQYNTLFGGQQ